MGDGRVLVADWEMPQPAPRQALVRILAGAVSTGTETTGIKQLSRSPEPQRQPWRMGYSDAGVVVAVGSDYRGPAVGTMVACYGGPYVGHSTYCAVGQHLLAATTLPMEQAAFNGIGAVAVHGVRQAEVQLGQRVGVVGLGVLGQFVAQFARAAGAFVLASDPLSSRRDIAKSLGADAVTSPDDFVQAAMDCTDGDGLDAVIVVAGTPDSSAPARQALDTLRFRGRLQIVGNVRTEWDREPLFQKEAVVQVARAAGPGRYAPEYELDGYDYPKGFVPWTEGRNVRTFVDFAEAGRIQVAPLISKALPLDEAPAAYKALIDQPNDHLAIVLKFPPA
jgi:threonine dehydrogenase-like Zn-dependent dehydrogenase